MRVCVGILDITSLSGWNIFVGLVGNGIHRKGEQSYFKIYFNTVMYKVFLLSVYNTNSVFWPRNRGSQTLLQANISICFIV